MLLPVNELFETIQGEAKFTGTPSVFIRLQGCPIGCVFCDTKHTWDLEEMDSLSDPQLLLDKEGEDPTYYDFEPNYLVHVIETNFMARHVVITGGEPAMYDLTELTNILIASGYSVQIETSGTFEIFAHPDTWVTLSPKIGNPGGYKLLDSAIERANEVKYPIGSQKHIEQLKPLANRFKTIWLQPLSQNKTATRLCIDEATANNWQLSIQTHKYIGVR